MVLKEGLSKEKNVITTIVQQFLKGAKALEF
jgi:hypothetical protein